MKTFDSKKIHCVPAILQDWAHIILNENASTRETYARNFEIVQEYCNYILEVNEQKRREHKR